MCFNFIRCEEEDLERTSLESEVYDLDVEGEGDSEEDGGTSDQLAENDTAVEFIEPADVTKVQYCIVASSKLMKLICRVHGEWCKRAGCDQPLEFKETYVGSCLVCHLEMSCRAFWGKMGITTNLCWSTGRKFAAGFSNCHVGKFLYQNWLSFHCALCNGNVPKILYNSFTCMNQLIQDIPNSCI